MTSLVRNVVQHWAKPPSPGNDMCEVCGKKPKFVDRGFKHPYCGRTCASKGTKGTGSSPIGCKLHGCRATGKAAFIGFCSEGHAREAVRLGQVKGCDTCRILPQAVADLCLACDRRAGTQIAPRLREIKKDSATFREVRSQFIGDWGSMNVPTLEKVYQVDIPRDMRIQYNKHRAHLGSSEELRTYHASQCICDLGTKDATLCNFKSCGICTVLRSSFTRFAFDVPYNNGRFGDGIYTYRDPGQTDRYATSCTSSPYRVMVVCDTLVQAGTEVNMEDSVFVDRPEAILPSYVLMYKM